MRTNSAPQKLKFFPVLNFKEITFADDYIFCRVLSQNLEITKELLEILLNIKIDHVDQAASQKENKVDYYSKGVRFDVYVKDGTGRCFDIEIQTSHYSNLAKRARYYQSVMDVDSLDSGESYKTLKDSYVIFLCLGDPFSKGLPVYTFRYCAEEDNTIAMDDGSVNIFFNAKLYDKMNSVERRNFFEYLCKQKTESDFTTNLANKVNSVKTSSDEKRVYMTFEEMVEERFNEGKSVGLEDGREEGIAQGMEKGREEGAYNKSLETAKTALSMNLPPETISKLTGLPLETILKLKNKK